MTDQVPMMKYMGYPNGKMLVRAAGFKLLSYH
jgi:hypothetical protein